MGSLKEPVQTLLQDRLAIDASIGFRCVEALQEASWGKVQVSLMTQFVLRLIEETVHASCVVSMLSSKDKQAMLKKSHMWSSKHRLGAIEMWS